MRKKQVLFRTASIILGLCAVATSFASYSGTDKAASQTNIQYKKLSFVVNVSGALKKTGAGSYQLTIPERKINQVLVFGRSSANSVAFKIKSGTFFAIAPAIMRAKSPELIISFNKRALPFSATRIKYSNGDLIYNLSQVKGNWEYNFSNYNGKLNLYIAD